MSTPLQGATLRQTSCKFRDVQLETGNKFLQLRDRESYEYYEADTMSTYAAILVLLSGTSLQ